MIDKGEYVASVFFDLSKSFDKVWHERLLAKLQPASIKGSTFTWFQNYLKTTVGRVLSAPSKLHTDITPGAILSCGPLLFSIYMNDIPAENSTNLFAEETSYFVVDSSPSALRSKLQERTDLLCAWFAKWLLNVNAQKAAVMVFRSRKMPPVYLRITANSAPIHQVRCHRHLGIHLNKTLAWSDHVVSVISKASARIGFLRRLSP